MSKSTCIGPECNRQVRCKRVCATHYDQMLAGKELSPIEPRGGPVEERLWPKVRKTETCWIWTAGAFSSGYGAFKVGGKLKKAHRVVYELEVGPIPPEMVLDHVCHNTRCVNPAHLRAVTIKQNSEHRLLNADNTSGHRGVSWHKRAKKWIAHVRAGDRTHHCGYYDTPEEAAEAARVKRNELFTHNNLDRIAA